MSLGIIEVIIVAGLMLVVLTTVGLIAWIVISRRTRT